MPVGFLKRNEKEKIMRSTNFRNGQNKGMNSVKGRRFKKAGGQSGGAGYNERAVGRAHEQGDSA
ncbi:MAG: hypothetical protein DYH13_05250 [Alphaproteobacteria bacterium PRO2]|nr:hypothetical protein [Alphaproteobacteria bacterium PRO2]